MAVLLCLLLVGGIAMIWIQLVRRNHLAPLDVSPAKPPLAVRSDGVDAPNHGVATDNRPLEIKQASDRTQIVKTRRTDTRPADTLTEVLDPKSDLPLSSRLSTLRTLGLGLTRAEWEAVRDFVRSSETIAELNPDQFRYLKNEAMSALIRADVWLDEAAGAFKVIYADTKQDVGIRNYALQFLAVAAENDARVGWDFHWEALQDEDKDLASTASLHLLGAANRGELTKDEKVRLGAAVLEIASSASLPATNRATALQVCAELGVREARKIADRVSRNESEDLIVRLSAIAALGQLGGGSETQAYLRFLSTGPDEGLRVAAAAALSRFKSHGG